MIWLLLISCIQIFWSKTLDISCRLFRTLWDGKIFGVYFHRHDGSYSLSVVYSRYSSPLASSFFKATSSNLICLASCRCLKWTVSENHRTRKYFRLMNAKLVFFKNAFNIFVCQSYCGVRFGSFTRVPGVWLSGLFSIPWILRPWGCLLSRCCHPGIAGYFARRRTLCQICIFWIVLFHCGYMKIAWQTVQLFWGNFHDLLFFAKPI